MIAAVAAVVGPHSLAGCPGKRSESLRHDGRPGPINRILGPLCVKASLRPFLPKPWIVREADGSYHYDTAREDREPDAVGESIGTIKQRLGNFGVLVRAYTYILALGSDGLADASRYAILAANYVRQRLHDRFPSATPEPSMLQAAGSRILPHRPWSPWTQAMYFKFPAADFW